MEPTPLLAVFGSRVRDVVVDVDLVDPYGLDPKLRDAIRFKENDFLIRVGTRILTRLSPESTIYFTIEIMPRKGAGGPKTVTIEEREYYVLVPGEKYNLKECPPGQTADGALDVQLPCCNRVWGGGGMNMTVAIRGMSTQEHTPVSYFDGGPELVKEEAWNLFWSRLREGLKRANPSVLQTDLAYLGKELGDLKDSVAGLSSTISIRVDDLCGSLEKLVVGWLKQAGERGYRSITELIGRFDPLDTAELFLTQQRIRFAMLRRTGAPAPHNLIFGRIRDESREITNRIIFRGCRPDVSVPPNKKDVTSFIASELERPGLVAINTVYDEPIFSGALNFVQDYQERQRGNGTADAQLCPVVVSATEPNMKNAGGPAELVERCKCLRNLYLIFNDVEFATFVEQIDQRRTSNARQFCSDVLSGRPPNAGAFRDLLFGISDAIPLWDQKVIVTLGPFGATGLTQCHVQQVATYAAPDKRIFGTSGCGDAFAAGVALFAYHKHNSVDWAEKGPGDDKQVEIRDLDRMLRLGTAAAYAKATNPRGNVTAREVVSIMRNAFLPIAIPCALGDEPEPGAIQLPVHAERVDPLGPFAQILDAS